MSLDFPPRGYDPDLGLTDDMDATPVPAVRTDRTGPFDFMVDGIEPAADDGPPVQLDRWSGPDRTGLPPPPDQSADQQTDRVDRALARAGAIPWSVLCWSGVTVRSSRTGVVRLAGPVRSLHSPNGPNDELVWVLKTKVAEARAAGDVPALKKALDELAEANVLVVRVDQALGSTSQEVDGPMAVAVAVVLVAAVILAVLLAKVLGPIGGPAFVLFGLGLLGRTAKTDRPADRSEPEPDRSEVPPVRSAGPPIDPVRLNEALRTAKVWTVRDWTAEVRLIRPEPAPGGGINGYSCELTLPGDTTFSDLFDKRIGIASFLDVDRQRVVVEAVPGYDGRARLWLPERDPRTSGPYRSPLREMPAVDAAGGVPVGLDVHGRRVMAGVDEAHWLVGGTTRSGKSMSARVLLLGLAKDPNVQLLIADPQGLGMWSPFADIAEYYEGGAQDPEVLDALARRLEQIAGSEKTRRRVILAGVRERGTHKVTRSKVTPSMIADRGLKCPRLVILLDEAQNYFNAPLYGKRITAAVTSIIKEMSAFGVTVILLSQKPTDGAIPTDIRDITTTRWCFSAPNTQFASAILGEDFRSKGADPKTLLPGVHAGTGYAWGSGLIGRDDPSVLLLADLIEDDEAAEIVAQAKALRLARRPELLPEGMDDNPAETVPVLDDEEDPAQVLLDVIECFEREGSDVLFTLMIRDSLMRAHPTRYAALGERGIPKLVKPFGLTPHVVPLLTETGMKRTNGLTLSECKAALRHHRSAT